MMVVYMSAQFLGAFIASGLACLVYFDKIDWNMDPVDGTCLLATCAQSDYSNSQVCTDSTTSVFWLYPVNFRSDFHLVCYVARSNDWNVDSRFNNVSSNRSI